ncbi:MAG: TatD DNase family protein [Moorella sp. (in: firmicutes)]|uniref:Putative deoxyribonuclease YcfH n=1 Tax=Neomoorella thermoacetica TaxID=1525 RepID=A0A1J5P619_NEOTH|nr:TatD DNase family protein [Moorella sp. (in: firmicutes)]OIQ59325.1 putative deoxyribonuclease YcfH [Moorella thermoacetica]
MVELIDSHAHLNDPAFAGDLDQVMTRLEQAGVVGLVNVGYDVPSSRLAVEQAHSRGYIYAAVAVHPHDALNFDEEAAAIIRGLAGDSRVVAIGETGLDYYRNLSPRRRQQEVFHWHLDLARSLRLPVIIHDRDAHEDTLRILQQAAPYPAGGVLHCFSGSWEMARRCLDLGFYISFAGPVTFKNAVKLRAVAARVPLERLLIETDCPYLTPEPHRGQRNEPAYVGLVAAALAAARGQAVEEVMAATTANARKLFGI